jgi:FMN-dependent NADH-azoreductase
MSTILYINSSIRNTGSVSRQLSSEFVEKLKATHAGTNVIARDLAARPVPHLDEAMMGAFFTPENQRTPEQAKIVGLSDELVAELLSADTVVIGAPMYNFSVSSTLKSWIDHVARAGVTFRYTDKGPEGMVTGKKVYIFTSRGGVYSTGPAKAMDFHETYLRAVLGFIGLTDIHFIHSEGLAMGDEAVNSAVNGSRNAMDALIAA